MLFTGLLLGQDAETESEQTSTQEKQSDKSEKTEEELRPEVFNPTDELSEDYDVAFPQNI